jgi:hypothetical protein
MRRKYERRLVVSAVSQEQTTITEESAKLRNDAAETSRLAALKVRPVSGTQRAAVLAFLLACNGRGATDDEISEGMGLSPNSVRPRRVELVEGGWVQDSGEVRPSAFGNAAIVWIVTDKAVLAS